jgi:sulfate permease, SulP family
LTRIPENTPVPGVLIVRIDVQMYYANVLTVRGHVKAMISEMESLSRAVIFDFSDQDLIDVTGRKVTKSLAKELHENGIAKYLADVHEAHLEIGSKTGILESIGKDHVFYR